MSSSPTARTSRLDGQPKAVQKNALARLGGRRGLEAAVADTGRRGLEAAVADTGRRGLEAAVADPGFPMQRECVVRALEAVRKIAEAVALEVFTIGLALQSGGIGSGGGGGFSGGCGGEGGSGYGGGGGGAAAADASPTGPELRARRQHWKMFRLTCVWLRSGERTVERQQQLWPTVVEPFQTLCCAAQQGTSSSPACDGAMQQIQHITGYKVGDTEFMDRLSDDLFDVLAPCKSRPA